MNCPDCETKMKMVDTRATYQDSYRRRRYECPKCKIRITTYEIPRQELMEISKGKRKANWLFLC